MLLATQKVLKSAWRIMRPAQVWQAMVLSIKWVRYKFKMTRQTMKQAVPNCCPPLTLPALDATLVPRALRKSGRAMARRRRTVCVEFLYWALLAKGYSLRQIATGKR